MTNTSNTPLAIDAELLEILRDPASVKDKETYGEDPGRFDLVHNCWLVSKDTNYKYPIKDGIPVMLIEEGKKWKDTAIDDLPVPPGPLVPEQSISYPADSADEADYGSSAPDKRIYLVALLLAVGLGVVVAMLLAKRSKSA